MSNMTEGDCQRIKAIVDSSLSYALSQLKKEIDERFDRIDDNLASLALKVNDIDQRLVKMETGESREEVLREHFDEQRAES